MAIVPMPETTVHKNDCIVFWEYQIGFSREVLSMEPVSKPQLVTNPSYLELWFSVFPANAGHVKASRFPVVYVHFRWMQIPAL
jgi:hypothetical protein